MSSREILIVLFQNVDEIEESTRLDYEELYDLLDDKELKDRIKFIIDVEERHRQLIEEGLALLKKDN